MDLLTIGLEAVAFRAPAGVRVHAVRADETLDALVRYGPAFDAAVVAAGLTAAETAVRALAPGVPVVVVAGGGPVSGLSHVDRAVATAVARAAERAGPPALEDLVRVPGAAVRAVSAWPLVALGRVGGAAGAVRSRSWRATLADVLARQAPGCGVAARYVVAAGALEVGLLVWGEGAEPSEARGRRAALERALAPLLVPAGVDGARPYVFGGRAPTSVLLAGGGVREAVRLRLPSAEETIGSLGPRAWEGGVVLEGADGLEQPSPSAAVGPLARVLLDVGEPVCVEVSMVPAPLSASEREAAFGFGRAARLEDTPAVRRAASRAAQLGVEGARALRVRVSIGGEGSVPEAVVVEAARALAGDPATVGAFGVPVHVDGGAAWFGDVAGGGALAERATPDEAAARFALPVPEGRPLWGLAVAPAPAPAGLPERGVRIGASSSGGVVRLSDEALRRHLYVVGSTGTGKSQFLVHVAARRAAEGRAVLVVDPHGDTAGRVARAVRRAGREVVEVDLGDAGSPWRLNPIEVDPAVPNARSVLTEALLDLFGQLWDMKEAGGPMFETYFRNAVYLTMSKQDSPGTLRDVWRVFSDEGFRAELLLGCEDPEVVRFWRRTAGRAGGEASLENIAPYVLAKLTPLVSNDALAHLTAARRSTLDVGALLERGACVVVRLDKGRLGSYGSRLAGTVVLSRVLLAAMRRTASSADALVVVDEFQNFVTPQMGELLAEARKFRVQFALAHQSLAQVPERLLQTTLGNAGNLVVFRPAGAPDAARLAPYLAPTYDVEGLLGLSNFRAACRVLVGGAPTRAFELRSDPPAG